MTNKDFNTIKESRLSSIINIFFIIITLAFLGHAIANNLYDFVDIILIPVYFIIFSIYAVFNHEFGHMIFGYISHYKLRYFQVLWFKFYYLGKKLKVKVENSFVLGQCLMDPTKDDKKYLLRYLSGGYVFNLIVMILGYSSFILLFILFNKVSTTLLALGLTNLIFYTSNGIPLNVKGIYNDRLNIRLVKKYDEVRKTILNSLIIDKKLMEVNSLSDIDLGLIKNSFLELPNTYIHKYVFDVAYTEYMIIKDIENPFTILETWHRNRSYLPIIYRKLNYLFIIFDYLLNDKDYRGIIYLKENNKILEDDNDFLSVLNKNFILYKDNSITKDDFINRLNTIESYIDDYKDEEYEKEVFSKMVMMVRDYLNRGNNEEICDSQ